MGAKRISLSLPEWIISDLQLDGSGNRSERIQELMIKGFMAEQQQKLLKSRDVSSGTFPAFLSRLAHGNSSYLDFQKFINGIEIPQES